MFYLLYFGQVLAQGPLAFCYKEAMRHSKSLDALRNLTIFDEQLRIYIKLDTVP